ncbi:hypothetical protein OG607_27390 [Streptomyces sp. NBC_01537]|uniref:hypothetical protein n=1 Tax=Streptomyces sp. NBC_01537 TaxID=2903896 RepID=UPI003867860D
MTNPDTDTNAPAAEAAYTDAPPIIGEISEVLILSGQLARPGGHTPQAVREQRLRKAALLDRIALQEAADYPPATAAISLAATAAAALAQYDSEHGTGTGPVGPSSPQWEPCHRPYVRQEYATWHQHQSSARGDLPSRQSPQAAPVSSPQQT